MLCTVGLLKPEFGLQTHIFSGTLGKSGVVREQQHCVGSQSWPQVSFLSWEGWYIVEAGEVGQGSSHHRWHRIGATPVHCHGSGLKRTSFD